ncbi:hypothetical protein EDD17DRAFT_1623316 [Pisolithus thermaeus]|nr:hypothetical protein EDD17DRAFT_1623316 [Pisolithus thermaeus]
MEVIDLSNSSPQTATRRHSVGGRHAKEMTWRINSGDIIELSDSELDDEQGVQVVTSSKTTARKSTRKNTVTAKEDADSKDPQTSSINVDVLPSDAQAPRVADVVRAEGSSQPRQDKDRLDNAPLFYPDSDEGTERPHSPGPPSPSALTSSPQVSNTTPPAVPHPPETPPAPVDPMDGYVARVTEIIPDVQPAHVLSLVERAAQTNPDAVIELVLHALFEDPSYPKIDRKGKRKRDEAEEEKHEERLSSRGTQKPRVDYLSEDREYDGGPFYFELSLEQLMVDYPRIPKPHIRKRLLECRFYARAFFKLARDLEEKPPPFKLKLTNSVISGKGKVKEDPIFQNELEWVKKRVTKVPVSPDEALAEESNEQDCQETGGGIECGCCFSSYPFENMVQCPDAHLFCKFCMTSYSSTLLGEHNPNIVCMDQSDCKLPFPESELKRFLTPKMLELYDRVKQIKEIEAAGLENLEECPFCEYKCVIENEMEKLFRCENTVCGAVTCRVCKRPDHLPKSCKEVEEDRHLDVQHHVEEAMTRALMRNCPKCQKAFIKEQGCNKMTCPNCHTVSCYICRQIITGYEHFDRPGQVGNKSKCILWEPSVERRHAEEVNAAAKQAMEELKKTNPDVDASGIKVDLATVGPGPSSRTPANQPVPPHPYVHIHNHNHNHNHVHIHGQNRRAHHFGGPVPAPYAPNPMPYRLPPHFVPPIPAVPIPPMRVEQGAGYDGHAELAPALAPLPALPQMGPNQMAPNQRHPMPPNPPFPEVPQQVFQMGNMQGQVGMPVLAQPVQGTAQLGGRGQRRRNRNRRSRGGARGAAEGMRVAVRHQD